MTLALINVCIRLISGAHWRLSNAVILEIGLNGSMNLVADALSILYLRDLISATHRLVNLVLIRYGIVDMCRIIGCQTVSPSFFNEVWSKRIIVRGVINPRLVGTLVKCVVG